MPNYTTNFELPYPNSDDDPCQFAQQWCQFTDAINNVLAGFEESANRTVPTIPMAGLRRTSQSTVAGDSLLVFDAVAFDTANWINFDVSASIISINRAGVFTGSGNIRQGPDGVNGYHSLAGTLNYLSTILDRGVAGQIVGNYSTGDSFVSPTPDFDTSLSLFSTAATILIESSYFSVFWHADTVRAS